MKRSRTMHEQWELGMKLKLKIRISRYDYIGTNTCDNETNLEAVGTDGKPSRPWVDG